MSGKDIVEPIQLTNFESHSNTSISNQSNIILTSNINTGIPPFIRFIIGLSLPVFLLLIPLTLFSIQDSLGDQYEWTYGENEFNTTLYNVGNNQYSGNYSLEGDYQITGCFVIVNEPTNSPWDFRCNDRIYGSYSFQNYLDEFRNENQLISASDVMSHTFEFDNQTNISHQICCISPSDYVFLVNFNIWDNTDQYQPYTFYRASGDRNYTINRCIDNSGVCTETVGNITENGLINLDDSENITYISIDFRTYRNVGNWSDETGTIEFDDENNHGSQLNILINSYSEKVNQEESDNNIQISNRQNDVASGGYISCCAILIISLILVIHGFATTGGVGQAIGAFFSIIICPILFVSIIQFNFF